MSVISILIFGIGENNEMFADKELKKEDGPNTPFETQQAFAKYWRTRKKKKS